MKLVMYNDYRPGLLVNGNVIGIGGLADDYMGTHVEDVMINLIEDFASVRDDLEDTRRFRRRRARIFGAAARSSAPAPQAHLLLRQLQGGAGSGRFRNRYVPQVARGHHWAG